MSKNKNKSLPSAVIDLTSSFTLADHCALSEAIIDLASDESFDSSVKNRNSTKPSSNDSTSVSTEKVNIIVTFYKITKVSCGKIK